MFKRLSLLLLVGSSSLIACTDKFEELNTDPNRIEKISPGTLLNPIIYSLASFNTLRSADFTFPIMQVALPFPSGSGGIQRYDVTETEGNSTWDTYYRWLGNIKEMRAAAVAANDPNYEAIALTLNAWIYSQLTDCFGDVPMDILAQRDCRRVRGRRRAALGHREGRHRHSRQDAGGEAQPGHRGQPPAGRLQVILGEVATTARACLPPQGAESLLLPRRARELPRRGRDLRHRRADSASGAWRSYDNARRTTSSASAIEMAASPAGRSVTLPNAIASAEPRIRSSSV